MSTAQETAKRGVKNEKVGNVVSAKMAKTIVVEVTRRVSHPVYKRIVSKRKKFYAHDEKQEARVGDVVRIVKCWQLKEILRKAVQVTSDLSSIGIEAAPARRAEKKK